jgi:hypothetical protein
MSSPETPEFHDRFVAFVDILGFKAMVAAAENNAGVTIPDILRLIDRLDLSTFEADLQSGACVCPSSRRIDPHGGFVATQVSDCVVISVEVSPFGVAQMLAACWRVSVGLLELGALCRGYLTRGSLFHTKTRLLGTAYQRAYQQERLASSFARSSAEQGTPYIEIDPAVTDYIKQSTDECVVGRFRFTTESDGENDAFFPFRAYEQSFILGGPYARFVNYDRLKAGEALLRDDVEIIKAQLWKGVDKSDTRVVEKVEHYAAALDRQLKGSLYRSSILASIS